MHTSPGTHVETPHLHRFEASQEPLPRPAPSPSQLELLSQPQTPCFSPPSPLAPHLKVLFPPCALQSFPQPPQFESPSANVSQPLSPSGAAGCVQLARPGMQVESHRPMEQFFDATPLF